MRGELKNLSLPMNILYCIILYYNMSGENVSMHCITSGECVSLYCIMSGECVSLYCIMSGECVSLHCIMSGEGISVYCIMSGEGVSLYYIMSLGRNNFFAGRMLLGKRRKKMRKGDTCTGEIKLFAAESFSGNEVPYSKNCVEVRNKRE